MVDLVFWVKIYTKRYLPIRSGAMYPTVPSCWFYWHVFRAYFWILLCLKVTDFWDIAPCSFVEFSWQRYLLSPSSLRCVSPWEREILFSYILPWIWSTRLAFKCDLVLIPKSRMKKSEIIGIRKKMELSLIGFVWITIILDIFSWNILSNVSTVVWNMFKHISTLHIM